MFLTNLSTRESFSANCKVRLCSRSLRLLISSDLSGCPSPDFEPVTTTFQNEKDFISKKKIST